MLSTGAYWKCILLLFGVVHVFEVCDGQNFDVLSLTPTHPVTKEFFIHMQKCKGTTNYL
jgi:hypothetical protein